MSERSRRLHGRRHGEGRPTLPQHSTQAPLTKLQKENPHPGPPEVSLLCTTAQCLEQRFEASDFSFNVTGGAVELCLARPVALFRRPRFGSSYDPGWAVNFGALFVWGDLGLWKRARPHSAIVVLLVGLRIQLGEERSVQTKNSEPGSPLYTSPNLKGLSAPNLQLPSATQREKHLSH